MNGKTRTGFEFDVDDDIIDDMELVDALAESDGGNPLGLSTVCKKVFGEEQRKRLYEHLREKDGKVKMTEVGYAIADVFATINDEQTQKN